MIKKILILLLFLFTINLTYAKDYNENFTEITLDAEGWCKDIEIPFKVYNFTEYEDRKNIKRNLCLLNYTPEEDGCVEFQVISGTYKIHNGPLESMEILKEGSLDENGEFSINFNAVNSYLIEIEPTGNFNSYYDRFELFECANADPTQVKQEEQTIFNQTFNYAQYGLTISLENTPIREDTEITIEDKATLPNLPENAVRTIKISPKTDDMVNREEFDAISLDFTLVDIKNSEIKAYEFNVKTQDWDEIKFEENPSSITIQVDAFGIYSISQTILQKEEEAVTSETTTTEPEVIEATEIIEVKDNTQTNILLAIGAGVFLVVIIIGFISMKGKHNKESKNYHDDRAKENQKPAQVLTTYNDTLEHAKNYLKQYKDQYGKDQLYRALEDAKTPKDIIDKAIEEVL